MVAFYGFRCIQNICQLRKVCKTLRDRIDRDIFKEVICVYHIITRKYNKIQSSRCLFPNTNLLNSMKVGESFCLLVCEYDSLNVTDDAFSLNIYYLEIVDGSLICAFSMDDFNFGSKDFPQFYLDFERFPENNPWDTKKISIYARKRAKIQ